MYLYRNGIWEEDSFSPADRFDGNFSPAMAISPSGEIWAIWAARRDGEKPKIYFSRGREGSWSEPRRVTAEEEYWELTPAIAFGVDGTLLVAWSGERDDNSGIYCARWEGDGFCPALMVSSPGRSPVIHPSLAVSAAGRSLLVWQGWDGDYYRVFYSLSDGREWSSENKLAGRERIDQVYPFVVSLEKDNWECFWVERGKLLSADGGAKGWSDPADSGVDFRKNLNRAGEPPVTGWVVEKDRKGNIQTRRVGITFDSDPINPARSEKAGGRNRVFIGYGDSITYGTGEKGRCYIPLLKTNLEYICSGRYTIHNEGYPGANTQDLLAGGGTWNCPGIEEVINRYNASHILIMAGTNDYEYGEPPSHTKNNLGAMIERARKGDCEPVLATIIPTCDRYPARYSWNENLNRNYIAPLAREKNCRFADPFSAYLYYGPWKRLLAEDCIHPVWPDGSRIIAYAWFPPPQPETTSIPTPEPAFTPASVPVDSGDYNGDGTSDLAIFRPASGLWVVRRMTQVYFGTSGDIPVSGDYSADGTSNIAIFRPATGLWAARGVTRAYFGLSSDTAVPIQFNPSSACSIGIFRGSSGLWAVKGVTRTYFGASGDIPIPGDYTGDGTKNLGIFRRSSGLWALKGVSRIYFGSSSDVPVPGDYSGDGTWTPAVFRPDSGLWAVQGVTRAYFGASSDFPVPGGYEGAGTDYPGIFSPISGLWAIRGLTRVYFGSASDVPVVR